MSIYYIVGVLRLSPDDDTIYIEFEEIQKMAPPKSGYQDDPIVIASNPNDHIFVELNEACVEKIVHEYNRNKENP